MGYADLRQYFPPPTHQCDQTHHNHESCHGQAHTSSVGGYRLVSTARSLDPADCRFIYTSGVALTHRVIYSGCHRAIEQSLPSGVLHCLERREASMDVGYAMLGQRAGGQGERNGWLPGALVLPPPPPGRLPIPGKIKPRQKTVKTVAKPGNKLAVFTGCQGLHLLWEPSPGLQPV